MKVHSFLALGEVLTNEAPGVQLQPLAPALRCTTVLILGYFLVFVLIMLSRTCCRASALLPALQRLTEPLGPVPMLCLLMISARLRATQLHRGEGDPQAWMPAVMYGCTSAFLVLVCSKLCEAPRSLQACLLVLVHGCVAAMLFGIVAMQPDSAHEERYPHLAMMHCFLVLCFCYFALSLCFELLDLFRPGREVKLAGSESSAGQELLDGLQRRRRRAMEMAPMFSVLLVAMSLRAVQLKMLCSLWTILSMALTTLALPCLALLGLPDPEAPSVLSPAKWLLALCVILGVATTLGGVFVMEQPLALLQLEPPIAVSMCCVMWIVTVYFAVTSALIVLRGLDSIAGKWEQAVDEVHGTLAFAAAICVTLVAVRLQVVQHHQRDPPRWAQLMMYTAAGALTVQVISAALVARCRCSDEQSEGGGAVWAKVGLVVMALVRILAMIVMYVAAVILIGALFALNAEV